VTGLRLLLGAGAVLLALLVQVSVLAALPLPGGAPDLVLVVVIAFALAEGPLSGMVTGLVAGLLADLLAVHELGRLALAYVVVGFATGLLDDDRERGALAPFVVVGAGAVGALLLYAAQGLLLGDPRVGAGSVGRALISSVAYDVALTPFVVPLVGLLCRRVRGTAD